jgi:dolichol kinase
LLAATKPAHSTNKMRKRPLLSSPYSLARMILIFECLAGRWSSFASTDAFTSVQQQQPLSAQQTQIPTSGAGNQRQRREGPDAPSPAMILFQSQSRRRFAATTAAVAEESATRLHSSKQSHSDDRSSPSTTSSLVSSRGSRSTVLWVSVGSLLVTTVLAQLGLLGGDYVSNPASIGQDVFASVLTGILGYAFVKINTYSVERLGLDPKDARKIIHTLSAPLFILFWPLFSANDGARFFAACVPLTNAFRLYLAATASNDDGGAKSSVGGSSSSYSDEAALARAVSRSGNSREALGGPFVYVLMIAAAVLGWWRGSPIGVVALATLAAGDGVADLVGRRLGRNNQWPGLKKSVAGTVGFVAASTVTSFGLLLWLQQWGCLTLGFAGLDLLERVALISTVSSFLELVPIGDDNYTVPLSAALLSMLLLS